MLIQIEWITAAKTASLWPSYVHLLVPVNSTKRPEMPIAWKGRNQVLVELMSTS